MKSIVRLTHVQISDVGVDFSRRNISVAQKRLHRTRVSSMLHQVRAEAVTQGVRRYVRNAGRSGMSLNDRPGGLPRHPASAVQE